eukprot:391765-Pyramimonas_sp.AAC.2
MARLWAACATPFSPYGMATGNTRPCGMDRGPRIASHYAVTGHAHTERTSFVVPVGHAHYTF